MSAQKSGTAPALAAQRRNKKARHGSAGKANPESESRKGRHPADDTVSERSTQHSHALLPDDRNSRPIFVFVFVNFPASRADDLGLEFAYLFFVVGGHLFQKSR